jgi:hypothetical protein
MKYLRIKPEWHRLDTEHGTFFGYSRGEVEQKARTAEIRAQRKATLQQIALEEREMALTFTDNRDSVRDRDGARAAVPTLPRQ